MPPCAFVCTLVHTFSAAFDEGSTAASLRQMPVHRWIGRTALTMIAVVLVGVGYSPPAHAAGWQLSDGFETRPADTYLSIQPFTFTRGGDFAIWRAVTTSTWVPAHREVYVRIGLIGEERGELDALEVDDLTVFCQYY